MAYYMSTIESPGILVLIKVKCHNNIIPYSGVMTKIFELLSLNKQKHFMELLVILLKKGNLLQYIVCISFTGISFLIL